MSIQSGKLPSHKLAFQLAIGSHVVVCDEPILAGGDDAGPTPHDLFDAALAGCTSMTVLLYARHKGWPLEDVRVAVTRDDSQERTGVYRIERKVELVGPLSEEQRLRLMEIADRCPIHRLMHAKIEISSISV